MKVLSILLGLVLVSGCVQPFACNPPYIKFGNECCMDINDNKICDDHEGDIKPLPETDDLDNFKISNIKCDEILELTSFTLKSMITEGITLYEVRINMFSADIPQTMMQYPTCPLNIHEEKEFSFPIRCGEKIEIELRYTDSEGSHKESGIYET